MLAHLDPRHWLARCVRCGCKGGVLCTGCAGQELVRTRTPGGLTVHALGRYAGHLGDCLRRLKYQDETHLAFPLGRALRTLAEESALVASRPLLMPVPLHPTRLVERGYNQSALIARQVASARGARLETSCLYRFRAAGAQAQLAGALRRANVVGAFRAQSPRTRSGTGEGMDAAVLLLDDVVTTGSTLDACALALAQVGIPVRAVLACAIAGDGRDGVEPAGWSAG